MAVQSKTISNTEINPLFRAAIQVGDALHKLHINPVSFSEEQIAAKASRNTGLSDYGDTSFREANEFVLRTAEAEGDLNLMGRFVFTEEMLRFSENRLRIIDIRKCHPEIAEEPITQPLFIVSFPRTGTTLLHHLLTLDSATQFPPMWQLLYPTPMMASQQEIDHRIKLAQQLIDWTYQYLPTLPALHEMEAQGPEECLFMLPNTYAFYGTTESPTYKRWFLARDSVPDYKYYREQIQVLQWQRPRHRWIFKFPGHLWKLDALLKVFPDAAIVQTHRHPKEMFASWCSLVGLMRRATSNKVDLHKTASLWLDMMKIGLERATEVRRAHSANFFDVNYPVLVADPIGTVHRIYDHFGNTVTPELEKAISGWVNQNPQQKHGVHHYSLEQFGLDEATITREFKSYIEEFNL